MGNIPFPSGRQILTFLVALVVAGAMSGAGVTYLVMSLLS